MTYTINQSVTVTPTIRKFVEALSIYTVDGEVFGTRKELGDKFKISERTVTRWIRAGEEAGIITSASMAGRAGKVGIRVTDKLIPGSDVSNPVSKPTYDMQEHLDHIVYGNKERRRISQELAGERRVVREERNRELGIRQSRYAELNALVAEMYRTLGNRIDIAFFQEHCKDEDEYKREVGVWLMSLAYDAYYKETTRVLSDHGCIDGNHDRYASLDEEHGWFGSRNHTVFLGVVNSYQDNNQEHNMLAYVTHMYSSSYHAVVGLIERGEKEKINVSRSRPMHNHLYYDNAKKRYENSFRRLYKGMERHFYEDEKNANKNFSADTDSQARLDGLMKVDTISSDMCSIACQAVANFYSIPWDEVRRHEETHNDHGSLARIETNDVLDNCINMNESKRDTVMAYNIKENEIEEYVMYARYRDLVVKHAESRPDISAEEVKIIKGYVVDFINLKRFGADNDVSLYDSQLSLSIMIGMSFARDKIISKYIPHGSDGNLTLQQRRELSLELSELYSDMLPSVWHEGYKAGTLDPKRLRKYERRMDMLNKLYSADTFYTQTLMGRLIMVNRQILGKTCDLHAQQEILAKVHDVLGLNEAGVPNWKVIKSQVIGSHTVYGEVVTEWQQGDGESLLSLTNALVAGSSSYRR